MAKWTFEPGHTAAEFSVRHMMVTWVRGLFGKVQGTLDVDLEQPVGGSLHVKIDAAGIWEEKNAPLFRSVRQKELTNNALRENNALDMIKRRARRAGLPDWVGCHVCRCNWHYEVSRNRWNFGGGGRSCQPCRHAHHAHL